MKTFIFIDFDFNKEQQQQIAAFTLRQSLGILKDFYALAWIKQQRQAEELMTSYWNRYDRPPKQLVLEFRAGGLPPTHQLDKGKTLSLAMLMADMGLDDSLDADLDQLLDII